MTGKPRLMGGGALGGLAVAWAALFVPSAGAHPYPTPVIADYVFACMAVNGQTQEALRRCSCSIDVISSILTVDQYEEAETVLSMRQVRGGGEKMALFRDTSEAKDAVDALRSAQVEAEVRCF